jgi:hypothetical protein
VKFKDLLPTFIAGTPIKRKVWKGFWQYGRGHILMHTKEGEVINLLDSKDVIFTISGILEDDWEVATEENTEIAERVSVVDATNPVETKKEKTTWVDEYLIHAGVVKGE